jgi:hypothetical protein
VGRLREGSGHDMTVEVARSVGEVHARSEGRVGWRSRGWDSYCGGLGSGKLGMEGGDHLPLGCWPNGLRLRRGCSIGLGVDVVLGGFVGAVHLGGVVLGGGSMIHGMCCWR